MFIWISDHLQRFVLVTLFCHLFVFLVIQNSFFIPMLLALLIIIIIVIVIITSK